MPEINLLQSDTTYESNAADRVLRVFARLLMLIVVAIVIAYGFLFLSAWRSASNLTVVKADIQTKQAEAIANKDRNELVTRQQQLGELEKLIDKHTYWSYLLPELARVTLKSAKYGAIDADSTGELTLTATLPSYDDLEKFLQIFDLPEYNQQFSNVKILSINRVQQDSSIQIEVRLELTFNPAYIQGRM